MTFPDVSNVFLQALVSSSAHVIGVLPSVASKAHVELYSSTKRERCRKLLGYRGCLCTELTKWGSIGGVKATVSNTSAMVLQCFESLRMPQVLKQLVPPARGADRIRDVFIDYCIQNLHHDKAYGIQRHPRNCTLGCNATGH
ncbi:hypothetical protein OBBRIDRAFT_168413 [Obba rivulosa]|uniref:Uncharacterized protein n=1 Tax=Obba rivulosa TaxID=1052685 RepID=A0A8E2AXK9_9APHY|nr:hypothetical protein OBBRIDRAFT_168413 [Obba rivulosa]